MKIFSGLITGLFLFFAGPGSASAQVHDSLKYHIAVFLPLYLDSAFDASGNYRFDQNFPKYLNPGLEFYEGLELAMDSLNKKNYLSRYNGLRYTKHKKIHSTDAG